MRHTLSLLAAALVVAPPASAQYGQGTTSSTTTTTTRTEEERQAPPPSTGAGSQQVVVNPPPSPGSTTVVNPPAAPPSGTVVSPPPPVETVVVEERDSRSSMAIVAQDAFFGGLAGALVGSGVALINEWDSWERDLMIGTGVGILVGTVVGGVHAYNESAGDRRRRAVRDGYGSLSRDPLQVRAPTLRLAGRF